jgi:molybdenum cofactor synthesis domain-containing protein
MARVEVLAVGKELLIGRTLNTNAHWIGRRLGLIGTMIKEMTTVDDDLSEISQALVSCLSRRPDFLVVLGGLGPTPDDMTLKGVGVGLGKRMVLNREALSLIRDHYARRGIADFELTPARRKMAILPAGAKPILNEVGTAPGVRLEASGTVVFCLPGVPLEMKKMFVGSVEPEVRAALGKLFRKAVTLKFEGIYESAMAPLIQKEVRENPDVYIKSHPRGLKEGVSRIELDIVAVRERRADAEAIATRIAREFTEAVGAAGGTLKSTRGLG